MVSSLFTPSRDWTVPLIRSSFPLEKFEAILSLHCGFSLLEDSLLWHYEKDGAFSVRSGYKLGEQLQGRYEPSMATCNRLWRKALWKLGISLKIRAFI